MTVNDRLLGRDEELQQIQLLCGRARNGQGGSLLVVGEPGIGKTSLLVAAAAALPGAVQLIRVDGFEAEQTFPFAAVQRLVRPLAEFLDALPKRHSVAMRVASGEQVGPAPDRFLVGLGILSLLAAAGESAPVVCAVDDAHLLDPESLDVFAFVGRRLEAESAVLLMAGREEPEFMAHTAGVATLRLPGLPPALATKLLTSALAEQIDPAAAAHIVAATGGNPLALIDLGAELTVRQLTETVFGDEPVPVGRHLEHYYVSQVRRLPAEVQIWLLVAAADSTGDLSLVEAAADELGLPEGSSEEAETAGLVELGHEIRFRHPLVRSAAYNAAHGKERRLVHRALARIAEKLDNAERAAWHSAKATIGTDEETAQQLEDVADLAARRGGSASRARVLVQAAALTPPGGRKQARLVGAAEAALAAGSGHLAKQLLDDIDDEELDPVVHGRLVTVGVDYSLFMAAPSLTSASAHMLRAAGLFHGEDAKREQLSLLRAWEWALPSERLTTGLTWSELGTRLNAGADLKPGPVSEILRGISALILRPFADAAPLVRRALDAYDAMSDEEILVYGHSSVSLSTYLWDLDTRNRVLERWAAAARDAGSMKELDNALWCLSVTEAIGGTPRKAVQYMEQVRELRRAIGYDAEHVVNVAVLAWTSATRDQVQTIAEMTYAMGFGGVQAAAMSALATVEIAERRYTEAYDRLKPFVDDPFFHVTGTMWPDFAEAAVRSGRLDAAQWTVDRLREAARVSGSPWAAGAAHRAEALLLSETGADDATVESSFRAALDALAESRAVVERGRANLLLGEWLRRRKRRGDARPYLEAAVDLFELSGAHPFAVRATRELEASGVAVRSAATSTPFQLTQQEQTVAELAAGGRTNAEIAATMFLSSNTIDYHLRKVFQKLGISSRRQLADKLGPGL